MTIYVFVGPTISEKEAQPYLDAVYLPPVSQGDIISLLRKRPHIIGIIDGYFEHIPAVWHKEILLALSEGVHVIGAASMGALRAAELYPFGMVGLGEIFDWYRTGLIEADDEVTVRHASAEHDYKAVGEALVNIRKTVQVAYHQGLITHMTMETLISCAIQLHYTQRSYPNLFKQALNAGVPETDVETLKGFAKINQKKVDAIILLNYIATLAKDSVPLHADFELQFTSKLIHLIEKDFCLGVFDHIRLTAEMFLNHVCLEHDGFLDLKDRTRVNKHRLGLGRQQNISITAAERQSALAHFQAIFNLHDEVELINRNHVTHAEFEQLITDWALINKLKIASFPELNQAQQTAKLSNHDFIRQLRWDGTYESLLKTAVAKEKRMAEIPQFEIDQLPKNQLYTFYFQQKKLPMPENIQTYLTLLGMGESVFMLELIKYYYYHIQ